MPLGPQVASLFPPRVAGWLAPTTGPAAELWQSVPNIVLHQDGFKIVIETFWALPYNHIDLVISVKISKDYNRSPHGISP